MRAAVERLLKAYNWAGSGEKLWAVFNAIERAHDEAMEKAMGSAIKKQTPKEGWPEKEWGVNGQSAFGQ